MTKFFSPKKIFPEKKSPGRIYSDRFLYENLEKIIPKKEISVLDIGCGSGYIRKIFFDLKYKLFYTGVDIKKHNDFDNFNNYSLENNFIKSKIEDFQTNKKFDLIFSICALEHIKDDKLAVSKFSSDLQIHIVPSFWSFFLYLNHGYRRYNPAKLKKIFKQSGSLEICRLGGFFSFILHLFFITIPERIFKSREIFKSEIYLKILNISHKLDRSIPIFPCSYVVVTKYNYD